MLEKLAIAAGVIDHPAQKREADSLHGTTSPAFTPRGPSSSEPSTDPTRPNTFHDGDDTNLDDDDDDDDAVRPTVTIGAPSEEMMSRVMMTVLSGLDDRLSEHRDTVRSTLPLSRMEGPLPAELLESEGIDVSLISPIIHEKPQGHELKLLEIVFAARARALRGKGPLSSSDLQLRSPSPTPSTAPAEDELSWNMNAWIKSISTPRSIDEIVCDACLAPLREDRSELGGESIEQEFIRQLGESDSHDMILRLLLTPRSNGSNVPKVLEEIAQAIYIAAKKLNGETADAEEGASKFFEDGEGSLKFGEISTFDEGLDGFLGHPSPYLREAMENEHCKSADATAIFRVPNFYTHTTSELEYWFVVDPTQEKLEELRFVRSSSDLPTCLSHPISE